ncbi:hypothetical protein [Pseudalkalibacillus caeni]|uniref:Uncharacterized protein n=1 Tax=Exobacillus caeni TaxID=2574798 RepID=A0A5R9F1I8_9BACL|nr:hypothetical protein [Pseudalkalibacillus caeni]TLS36300.1 hypothetical protein FCL54_15320 [Pseudalkalibacillus caeni]
MYIYFGRKAYDSFNFFDVILMMEEIQAGCQNVDVPVSIEWYRRKELIDEFIIRSGWIQIEIRLFEGQVRIESPIDTNQGELIVDFVIDAFLRNKFTLKEIII